jgi:hypothetical protein
MTPTGKDSSVQTLGNSLSNPPLTNFLTAAWFAIR